MRILSNMIPIQPFLQPVTPQPRAVVAKAEPIHDDGPSRDPRFEVDSCSVRAAVLTSGPFDPLKRGAAQAPPLSGSTPPTLLSRRCPMRPSDYWYSIMQRRRRIARRMRRARRAAYNINASR